MNKRELSSQYKAVLRSTLRSVLSEILEDAESDQLLFDNLKKNLSKLDLLVVVTYEPWSKFPWHRTSIPFAPALLSDASVLESLTDALVQNILDLLVRDLSQKSEPLLLLLNQSALLKAIEELYINEFTGDALAHLLVRDAVDVAIDESGVFEQAAVKNGFVHVERIAARSASRALNKGLVRIDQSANDALEIIHKFSDAAIASSDARFELDILKHRLNSQQ